MTDFERKLDQYAELAVKIGLNLQPGQRLLIHRAILDAAPLVRRIAVHAYRAGAQLVDVLWEDDPMRLIRFEHAPRDSFAESSAWRWDGMLQHIEQGGALLSLRSEDPDLLKDQDPQLVSLAESTRWKAWAPISPYIMGNRINWLVFTASTRGWASRVYPDLPAAQAETKLWEQLFAICRLDQPDPVAAWEANIADLSQRADYLNSRHYDALHFRGPGTDLTVGLAQGHFWQAARSRAANGIDFTANIPTEEVFTAPHRARTHGVVRATMPLSYGSALIRDFQVVFEQGRAVSASAAAGEAVLRDLIATDEGAGRLGEVALVTRHSPIFRSQTVFYHTVLDENAASHIALGRAYRMNVQGGEAMTDDEFFAAGGNASLIHVDFMIGSPEVDVDGIRADGVAEPVMRQGDWAFAV